MEKKILVPLAEGFEMVEALSIVDVFRRAGASVDIAAVGETLQVTSSHQVPVIADIFIGDCQDQEYDLIVLPGGIPGADNLKKSEQLAQMLKKQNDQEKLYGAICASPAVVLENQGLLEGKQATCHPLFVEKLPAEKHVDQNVVFDKNCVTSRGAGTSIEFGLELVGIVMGEEKKQEVSKQLALI